MAVDIYLLNAVIGAISLMAYRTNLQILSESDVHELYGATRPDICAPEPWYDGPQVVPLACLDLKVA